MPNTFSLTGTVCPVPAFFNADKSLNLSQTRAHIEFLLNKGIRNFYCALSASQLEFMSLDERVSFITCVSESAKSEPYSIVLAQSVGGNSLTEMQSEIKTLNDSCSIDAFVIKPLEPRFGSNFFSSKYKHSSYSPDRHDNYYIDYINSINELGLNFIFHD